MYAMNYSVPLPADYDMAIIHRRVAERGHLTDDYEGLGFKAYLVREIAAGAPVNEYAPFYVWDDTGGMNRFLWGGGGFGGIVGDFGRPPVAHWTGAAFADGPAAGGEPPRAAGRLIEAVPRGADPREAVARALETFEKRAAEPEVFATVLAVDPRHWEIVRFTLWRDEPEPVGGEETFRVLHLSAPHFAELPRGPQWPAA
jgi:hypothetical protein